MLRIKSTRNTNKGEPTSIKDFNSAAFGTETTRSNPPLTDVGIVWIHSLCWEPSGWPLRLSRLSIVRLTPPNRSFSQSVLAFTPELNGSVSTMSLKFYLCQGEIRILLDEEPHPKVGLVLEVIETLEVLFCLFAVTDPYELDTELDLLVRSTTKRQTQPTYL